MKIDDIVDDVTGQDTPGERFHDDWLQKLPVGQWPSYIDENARLVADDIFIGDTDLTKADFGPETGVYYRRGLARSADVNLEETSLPLGNHSDREIGKVAWVFNRLQEELRASKYTDFENPSRAVEAAINKVLVESIEQGQLDTRDLETIRLPDNAMVSTLVSEIFCRPRSEAYIDLLLQTVSENATSSLLRHLEEPRMVTTLWNHQREALDAWLANGCRGYVDMATATGKTILGLAAIAHHFGALHPADRDLTEEAHRPETRDRATVVVVAHRDIILDQWKREFDVHLNIPQQSTTRSGEHTVAFEWGDVHFWTPNRLQEAGVPNADLVVLDETHHYIGSSGFGGILDEIDGDLLALSGSLDEANARSLERRNIPELFEFSLRDGQRAGIIPQCDWDVIITPYENQSQLAEITAECRKGIKRYAGGIDVPDDLDVGDMPLTFETLSEARSLAQTSVGRELKERDTKFREFASAVMARQLTQYNLSPALSTVVRLILDYADQHKCVVLLETGDEIEQVTSELEARLGDEYESLITVFDDEADLSAIETFDQEQESGAIIGVARTLGEGVDIETADVCINRGRGRLSRSLVQRMGRILRNPDGDKHAQFFHVSGIPTQKEATLIREDGVTLLETASQLLAWGEGFDARPVFEVDTETVMTERDLTALETAGGTAIDEWTPDHYQWPSDDTVHDHLESLQKQAANEDGSALLAISRQPRTEDDSGTSSERGSAGRSSEETVQFVAADGGAVELAGWLYELVEAAADDDVMTYVEDSVRSYAREAFTFPSTATIPAADTIRQVPLNPALDAVLTAYAAGESREAAVHVALARSVSGNVDALIAQTTLDESPAEIRTNITKLVDDSGN